MSLKALQDIRAIAEFKKRANALHANFHNGTAAVIELGREINQFIESGLYQAECPTVEAFFKKNFNWSESYVNRLRRAAKFVTPQDLLGDSTGEVAKSAMRSAKGRSKSKSSQTVRNPGSGLSSQNEEPETAADEAPGSSAKPAKVDPETDENGRVIPEHALQYWHRKQEVQDALTALSRIRSNLKHSVEKGDKLWIDGNTTQRLGIDLDVAYTTLQNFMPYAVCTVCQGHVANGACDVCHGTGMVSKFHYNQCSDKRSIDITRRDRANIRP